MKNLISILFCLVILCSWCKHPIHDDYYEKDKEVFDAHLQYHQPEYNILCPMCYRQIQEIFKKYYEKVDNVN